jgi:predicted RND superfamily exporter protein
LREAGATVTVVSEPLVIDEILDAMAASQTRSIITTLLAALLLLVGYYGIAHRRPLLGAVTMVPSTLSVAWVLGAMYLLGLSFNVLTSTIAALAIGIGVPYGIHITHRFVEDRRRASQVDEAMRATIMHTGGALAGSAATTAIGFGVLVLSDLAPIQQFGGVSALTIIFALAGSVLVQPSLLVLWDRADRRRHPTATADPASTATPTGTGGR